MTESEVEWVSAIFRISRRRESGVVNTKETSFPFLKPFFIISLLFVSFLLFCVSIRVLNLFRAYMLLK